MVAAAPSPPALIASASELLHTRVVATLQAAHEPGKNLLYCATMPFAWRELMRLRGAAIELEPALDLAGALNRAAEALSDSVLDEASYVACGGEGPAVIKSARAELQRKFGSAEVAKILPHQVAADTWLVYSYLFKNLELATPLSREEGFGLRFRGDDVQHFGYWTVGDAALENKRTQQVLVRDFRAEDDFVVELVTKAEADRLIIARIHPGATLAATAEAAMARAGASPGLWRRMTGSAQLRRRDTFKMPMLDMELMRNYDELVGPQIVGAGRFIGQANQQIRLRLDETGALLRSEVAIGAPKGASLGIPPRWLVCDGPFAVLMARRDARQPYLALWIDNSELLLDARSMF